MKMIHSLIYRLYKLERSSRGPNTETSLITYINRIWDMISAFLLCTIWQKEDILSSVLTLIQWYCSFTIRWWCGTLSNALLKSNSITAVWPLIFKFRARLKFGWIIFMNYVQQVYNMCTESTTPACTQMISCVHNLCMM